MRRKYNYMIRVGTIALCLLCVLVCLAVVVSTAWGEETSPAEENLSQPACEVEAMVCEAEEEAEIIAEPVKEPADDQDLMLLAKLISCEMGCDWISAEQKYKVGSVVLNRVARIAPSIDKASQLNECMDNGMVKILEVKL